MREPRAAVYHYAELSYKAKKKAREDFKERIRKMEGRDPGRKELILFLRDNEFTVDGSLWNRLWEKPCRRCNGVGIIIYVAEGKTYKETCPECHGLG